MMRYQDESSTAFYPEGIDVINRLFDLISGSGEYFKHLFSVLPEFVRIWRPNFAREDWFWVAEFSVAGGGLVEIFFPWCQNRYGNLKLNKSSALRGSAVREEDAFEMFQRVVDIFWDRYFSRSYHNPKRKLPQEIFSRTLNDGRKVVPGWYVDVRAYFHPIGGDASASYSMAIDWFRQQGYEIVWRV
jgi:hypothetical protein